MKIIKHSDIKKQVKKIIPNVTTIKIIFGGDNLYCVEACEVKKKANFVKEHWWQNEYVYKYYRGQYFIKEDKLIMGDKEEGK